MRLIDADALLMNMNLAIAILEGTMKNLGLQDDAECQMELKAYRNIRDGIKDEPTAEPTAQPEQRWIPVTESLPEDGQLVIFSTKTGRVHQGKCYGDNSANKWYSALDKMRAWNNVVNAWMPLPEPYREGEQDE